MTLKTTFLKNPARIFAALLLAPLLALAAAPVRAADFAGETIEWIVPFKEGGGTDRWARFYAPLLSQHLPGQPKIVVKNIPGGGSITGANQFARRAKPDGLTIFGSSSSMGKNRGADRGRAGVYFGCGAFCPNGFSVGHFTALGRPAVAAGLTAIANEKRRTTR